jgi:hypothetical protein
LDIFLLFFTLLKRLSFKNIGMIRNQSDGSVSAAGRLRKKILTASERPENELEKSSFFLFLFIPLPLPLHTASFSYPFRFLFIPLP